MEVKLAESIAKFETLNSIELNELTIAHLSEAIVSIGLCVSEILLQRPDKPTRIEGGTGGQGKINVAVQWADGVTDHLYMDSGGFVVLGSNGREVRIEQLSVLMTRMSYLQTPPFVAELKRTAEGTEYKCVYSLGYEFDAKMRDPRQLVESLSSELAELSTGHLGGVTVERQFKMVVPTLGLLKMLLLSKLSKVDIQNGFAVRGHSPVDSALLQGGRYLPCKHSTGFAFKNPFGEGYVNYQDLCETGEPVRTANGTFHWKGNEAKNRGSLAQQISSVAKARTRVIPLEGCEGVAHIVYNSQEGNFNLFGRLYNVVTVSAIQSEGEPKAWDF